MESCNFNKRGKKRERGINMVIFEEGKTLLNQNKGMHIKGASTRSAAAKSFNLYARKEY